MHPAPGGPAAGNDASGTPTATTSTAAAPGSMPSAPQNTMPGQVLLSYLTILMLLTTGCMLI